MAMINRPECGHEISDKAPACPYCGAEKQPEYGTVLFAKQPESAAKRTAKTKVFVDDEWITDLKDGDTYSLMLPFGEHKVTLKTMAVTTEKTIVLTAENAKYTLSFGIGIGKHNLTSGDLTKGRVCPYCGGTMQVQTVTQRRKMGFFTALLIVVCTLGIGLLILLLRKKDEVVTYAVCQSCGKKIQLK